MVCIVCTLFGLPVILFLFTTKKIGTAVLYACISACMCVRKHE